jgi:hypothetical protein
VAAGEKINNERDRAAAILRDIASRAWRRPVEEAEIVPFLKLYEQRLQAGEERDAALFQPLAAILASPFALYVVERKGEQVAPLTGIELANRLSLFLWGGVSRRALRRLTNREYANILHDLLGLDFLHAVANLSGRLPKDDSPHSFTNDSNLQVIQRFQLQRRLDLAEELLSVALPDDGEVKPLRDSADLRKLASEAPPKSRGLSEAEQKKLGGVTLRGELPSEIKGASAAKIEVRGDRGNLNMVLRADHLDPARGLLLEPNSILSGVSKNNIVVQLPIVPDRGVLCLTNSHLTWHDPETSDVPLVSASCVRAAADADPKKPVDPNELTSTVQGSLCPKQDATLAARWRITDTGTLLALIEVAEFKGNRNGTYSGANPADVLLICQRKPIPAALKPDPQGDARRLVGSWMVLAEMDDANAARTRPQGNVEFTTLAFVKRGAYDPKARAAMEGTWKLLPPQGERGRIDLLFGSGIEGNQGRSPSLYLFYGDNLLMIVYPEGGWAKDAVEKQDLRQPPTHFGSDGNRNMWILQRRTEK